MTAQRGFIRLCVYPIVNNLATWIAFIHVTIKVKVRNGII